jgi:hypothetical protein
MKKPTSICLHHSAVSRYKNPDQFKANNNYHKQMWGFKSSLGYYLGYNYEIATNGLVRKARADGEQTAACYQKNMNNGQCIHICVDGNFDIEKPSPSQIYALRDLLKELSKNYAISSDFVYPHSKFAPKSCPGQNFDMEFVRKLLKNK